MDRKALLVPWSVAPPPRLRFTKPSAIADTASSGLVLGSSYLSTSLPTSFALDRPLHTVGVVLLLSGLAIIAYETWAWKNRRSTANERYVAIPLTEGNGRPSSEEAWPPEERTFRRGALSRRGLAALLVLLLFGLCGRIALFFAVMKDVACTGPTVIVRLDTYQMDGMLRTVGIPPTRPRALPWLLRAHSSPRSSLERRLTSDFPSRSHRTFLPLRPDAIHPPLALVVYR